MHRRSANVSPSGAAFAEQSCDWFSEDDVSSRSVLGALKSFVALNRSLMRRTEEAIHRRSAVVGQSRDSNCCPVTDRSAASNVESRGRGHERTPAAPAEGTVRPVSQRLQSSVRTRTRRWRSTAGGASVRQGRKCVPRPRPRRSRMPRLMSVLLGTEGPLKTDKWQKSTRVD